MHTHCRLAYRPAISNPSHNRYWITGIVATLIFCICTPCAIAAPAVPLHTAGPYIVDSNGYRVRLNAVNWYGTESKDYVVMGLQANTLQNIANAIKSRGFNAVRLPWSNEMYEQNPVVGSYALTANPSLQGLTALDIFDQVVSTLTGAGLMVILDNHNSDAEWCCGNDGNTLWYNANYPESSWISDWQGMVQRYASNSMVIGVDLRNEPRVNATWGGSASTDWHAAAQRGGNAVLAVNPNLLVFVEGISYAGDLSGVASLPVSLNVGSRVVYEAHDYGYWYSGLTGYSDYVNRITPKWGYLVTGNAPKPLWIGEFGTCHNASTCVSSTNNADLGYWYSLIHRYLWSHSVDWSYWAFNGTTCAGHGGGFGSVEGYGIMNATWDGDALPALTSDLQSLIYSGGGPAVGTYKIINADSGLAMEVKDWSTANGGIVDQWAYGGSQANQKWVLTYLNNGLYQLKNVNSGKMLDVTDRSTVQGAKMQQWDNLSGSNQEFIISQTSDGYYQIVSSKSGYAVEVPGFSKNNGTQLDQWGLNGGKNQKWQLLAP